MSEYIVRIVTPRETVFEGEAESIVAPGEVGDLGILSNHAPLTTLLRPGTLIVKQKGQELEFEIGKGFLEVRDNQTSILVTSATKR